MFGLLNKKPAVSARVQTALDGLYSEHEIAQIDRLGTVVELDAGRELILEGAIGREALMILSGTAKVSRAGEVVAEVGRGDLVGEAALLTGARRNASLVASTAVSAVVFTPAEFASLFALAPRLEAETKALLAQRS